MSKEGTGNITAEGWGKLRHIRGRDARVKREPTCATGRHSAAHGDDPVLPATPRPPDAESTCINATGAQWGRTAEFHVSEKATVSKSESVSMHFFFFLTKANEI